MGVRFHQTTIVPQSSSPPGACLDLNRDWIVEHCRHDSVLLIENWENLELTHDTPLLGQLPGDPLVIFRGALGSYKKDTSEGLLAELQLPVITFTGYYPKGLCVAATLPYCSRYLAPSDECLPPYDERDQYRAAISEADG